MESANIINIPTQLIKGRVKEVEGREITVQVRAHAVHMPIHPGYLQTVADYYGVLTCIAIVLICTQIDRHRHAYIRYYYIIHTLVLTSHTYHTSHTYYTPSHTLTLHTCTPSHMHTLTLTLHTYTCPTLTQSP